MLTKLHDRSKSVNIGKNYEKEVRKKKVENSLAGFLTA